MIPEAKHFTVKAVGPAGDGSVVVLGLNPNFHADAQVHPDICVLVPDARLEELLNGLKERQAMRFAADLQGMMFPKRGHGADSPPSDATGTSRY